MRYIPDSPEIERACRTGYGYPTDRDDTCPICGNAFSPFSIELDGAELCPDCFSAQIREIIHDDPEYAESEFGVAVHYYG